MFANGLGPICANMLTTMIVNPNNIEPSIEEIDGSQTYKFYDYRVASRVPWMFQCLVICEFAVLVVATSFIYIPPQYD